MARESRGLAALGGLAEAGGLGPEQPVAVDRGDQRLGVELARRGDQADLELPGAPALANHEVAQEALLVAPVPGAEALVAAEGEHLLAHRVAALGGQHAIGDRLDPVEAPGCVEAAHQLAAVAGPERVLELVAVAPLLDGAGRSAPARSPRGGRSAQRVADLLVLDLELALVGQHLPRRAGMVGDGRDAIGRGLEDLDRARLGVGALGLADDRAHAVARHGAGDEHDVAVAAGDAVAAVGERVDGELELIAARGAGRGCRGGGHGVSG